MAAKPKRFQEATIKAALKTLKGGGARRFLVADEVGLGKTVVARGVIEGMMKYRHRPLSVLYVCSNLTIAAQNLTKLVAFLSHNERRHAECKVDRPSLLVTQAEPTHEKVRIYSLTPQTAVPTGRGQSSGGRKEERALAYVMLLRIVGKQYRTALRKALRGSVKTSESFNAAINEIDPTQIERLQRYQADFGSALRDILGLGKGQHLPGPILKLFAEPKELARVARSALALASLKRIHPDLVIFDEFQKFSDLVQDGEKDDDEQEEPENRRNEDLRDRAASQLLTAIRGRATKDGPALLLLSATPYEPYKSRREVAHSKRPASSHSDDFFHLIEFLGDDKQLGDIVRQRFVELSEEIRKGLLDSKKAQEIREELERHLQGVMSRTERPQQVMKVAADSQRIVDADLVPADINELVRLRACFAKMPEWVLPMWHSVPLPMQTMGNRYVAWRQAAKCDMLPVLSNAQKTRYERPKPWPHPRLRALLKELSQQQLALPWVAPSMPWWPLADGWQGAQHERVDGKLLIFSRFRAVPPALAGLISYSLEANILKKVRANRAQVSNRQWLQPDSKRAALLELFYPSRFLAELDPLPSIRQGVTPKGVVAYLRKELRAQLNAIGIEVVRSRSRRPDWRLIVAIEEKKELWKASKIAWDALARSIRHSEETTSSKLAELVAQWDEYASQPLDEISELELESLTRLALESPGVTFFRALKRHWSEAGENFSPILGVVWRGLRNYFDSPWFAMSLGAGEELTFPKAIRQAVISGNLEAVWDEHFWYLDTEGTGTWAERLNELETALRLRDATVTLHESGPSENEAPGTSFRLGCHVAVPLNEAKIPSSQMFGADGDAQDLRPDLVRRAFNSPFWPNVLITTSVGQEGLDFHPWCRALAHWDLAPGPVALEQREGRITRFCGLSVRRVIAKRLRARLLDAPEVDSPWKRLATLADHELADASGLAPWWYVEPTENQHGSSCQHLFFAIPASELRERHADLARERALYRLVLGMPDQADLLAHLASHVKGIKAESIRKACLNLSAFDHMHTS